MGTFTDSGAQEDIRPPRVKLRVNRSLEKKPESPKQERERENYILIRHNGRLVVPAERKQAPNNSISVYYGSWTSHTFDGNTRIVRKRFYDSRTKRLEHVRIDGRPYTGENVESSNNQPTI